MDRGKRVSGQSSDGGSAGPRRAARPRPHHETADALAVAERRAREADERLRALTQEAERELRALETVTDTALTHLTRDDLLREVLERVRTVMAVDNVAILLLDEQGQTMTIRAARGPEEAVAGQVRVPLGRGFAGRIAASGAPLVVDDLAAFDVVNPFLKERLTSALGVPLVVEGRVLGAMHVGTVAPRHFPEREVQLLQRVADRVALALDRGRLYDVAQARAAQLEAVIEAGADSLAVYDLEGRVIVSNAAYRAQLERHIAGTPADTLRERYTQAASVRDTQGAPMPEERWPEVRVLRGETLMGAGAVEVMVGTPAGEELYYSVTGAPLRDEQGRVTGAVCQSRDVTERRRLERRTRDALEALLEMAGALVSPEAAQQHVEAVAGGQIPQDETLYPLAALCGQVLGCDRVAIVVADPETQRLRRSAVTGSAPELVERWRADLEQIALADRFEAGTLAQLRSGEAALIEMEGLTAEDPAHRLSRRHFLVAPMLAEGALVGYVGVHFGEAAKDYTEERIALTQAVARLVGMVVERDRIARGRAEANAREMALLAANQRMDDFVGMAAHDLRSPVTAAKLAVQVVARRLSRIAAESVAVEEAGRALQTVMRSMDRLARLVDRLLDASRVRTGRLDLHREECDLAQVMRECVEEQRTLAPGRRIALDLPGRGGVRLLADPDRVAQVVTNYLTNALRYAPADRSIEVALRREAGRVRVSVRDEGPGIPLDEQEAIWASYQRASGVTPQVGAEAGLGLGLYISREIVQRHGGQVGVTSEPGKGATFWFTLPTTPPT